MKFFRRNGGPLGAVPAGGGVGETTPTTTLSPTPLYGPGTLSNGNLTFSASDTASAGSVAVIPAGSHYFEAYADIAFAYHLGVGIGNLVSQSGVPGFTGSENSIGYFSSGDVYVTGSNIGTISSYATGATVGVKVIHNGSTGTVAFTTDGATYSSGYSINTILSNGAIYAQIGTLFNSAPIQGTMNFGATAYTYGLPSGFSSIPV